MALCLGLAACYRELPPGDPRVASSGRHPWDAGRPLPFAPQKAAPQAEVEAQQTEPESLERGPAFSPGDTLSEADIPGRYLQVVVVREEKMSQVPLGYQDILTLEPGGHFLWKNLTDWQEDTAEGSWRKPGPGKLQLELGPDAPPVRAEMFGRDFLYFWSSESKAGFWWARIPEASTDRIGFNSFSTNRGTLKLRDVVGSSFTGTVEGPRLLRVNGNYQRGVLVLRWEEEDRSAGGYAAFIAGADWKSLQGVWWLDDYEAAPFGGQWNGTAD